MLLQKIVDILDLDIGHFRNVNESDLPFGKLKKRAEIRDTRHFSFDDRSNFDCHKNKNPP